MATRWRRPRALVNARGKIYANNGTRGSILILAVFSNSVVKMRAEDYTIASIRTRKSIRNVGRIHIHHFYSFSHSLLCSHSISSELCGLWSLQVMICICCLKFYSSFLSIFALKISRISIIILVQDLKSGVQVISR